MGVTQEVVEVLYTLKDFTQSAFRSLHDSLDAGAKKADTLKEKLENVGRVGQVLAVGAGAVAAAFGFMAFQSLKLAGNVEQQRVAFKGLLGSYEEADKVIARIRDVAAKTPFETEPLTNMTQQLSVITRDGMKAVDILTDIGDAISMSGKDVSEMERVVLNIQQVAATGKVTEMDIRQFQSAIPMFNDILAASGLTTESLKNNANAAQMLFGAFHKAAEAGGITFGGLDMQSKTLNGTLSTLHDNFANIARQLGDGLLPIVQPVVNFFNGLLGTIGELSPKTKTFIAVMVITVGILATLATGIGVVLAMLPAIAAGLDLVGMAANGALLFIPAAIAGIVAGITLLVLNFDKLKNGVQNTFDKLHIALNNFLIKFMTSMQFLINIINKIPGIHIDIDTNIDQLKKDNETIQKEIDKRNTVIIQKEKEHADKKKDVRKMDTTNYKDELKKQLDAFEEYSNTLNGTDIDNTEKRIAALKKILDANNKTTEGYVEAQKKYNKLLVDLDGYKYEQMKKDYKKYADELYVSDDEKMQKEAAYLKKMIEAQKKGSKERADAEQLYDDKLLEIKKANLDRYKSYFDNQQNYQKNIIMIGANAYVDAEKKKYTASIKAWMAQQTAIAAGEIASIIGIPMGLLRLLGVGVAGAGVAAIEAIQLAEGGSMVVDSPTRIGPNVIAGEAGPEEIKVTPLGKKGQSSSDGGGREVLILADDGSVFAKALYHRQTSMIRTGEISPRRNG